MRNLEQLEKRKIQRIANQYKKNGYQVILEPNSFPHFLKNVRPDMVALSQKDNVLIEVVSKETVHDREKLENLAKIVQNRDNWRFELIVTNPKDDSRETISTNEIIDRLQQAEELVSINNHYLPAIMLAWSATEATLRKIASKEKAKISKKDYSPIQLTKKLYTLGLIGRSSYEVLFRAAKRRNIISHGYRDNLDQIDNDMIFKQLIQKTYNLIQKSTNDNDNKKELTTAELVNWFCEHYEDPANGVPFESREGGYIYINGGPYDPWEVLADEFPEVNESIIEEAAKQIYLEGYEWVKKGQY